jgi:hypothetical protein
MMCLLIAIAVLAGPARSVGAEGFDASLSDPRAVQLADTILASMGGKDAWESTRYLRFDMISEKDGAQTLLTDQYWDKHTGRLRLEAKTDDGTPYVVLQNVNTGEGAVYIAGQRAAAEQEKALLQKALSSWKSSIYWLFMPYKMKDPGVKLAWDGEEKLGDATYDKVLVSFVSTQDKFWAYINRDTHLMDRWSFLLGGRSGEPVQYLWNGWRPYGKILIAPERVSADGSRKLLFPHLTVFPELPDSTFSSPEPVQVKAGS